MLSKLRRLISRFPERRPSEWIDPDETFLDSSNLPGFDTSQFEGRFERPIARRSLVLLGCFFALAIIVFGSRLWMLQVQQGSVYAEQGEENRFKSTHIFSDRGVIFDRNGTTLAWNDLNPDGEYSLRRYIPLSGFAHVLGYVNYPKKDKYGFYYQEDVQGTGGVEEALGGTLAGVNGLRMVEIDAHGNVTSASITLPAKDGENAKLSVDARIEERLHSIISKTAAEYGFQGGAGVFMDIHNGEILALTSFPEYSPEIMANGDTEAIRNELLRGGNPFLNRVVSGLYTPGSIVKPFMAAAALAEGIITPEKKILSTGCSAIGKRMDGLICATR
jgi:penicillin-binding protein 2